MRSLFGYQDKNTPIHQLNAVAKLVYFLVTTVAVMLTYDLRLIIVVSVVSLIALKVAQVDWQDVSFVVKFMTFFSVLNLVTIFLLSPQYGERLYGSRTVLLELGYYTVTAQQLFYELNVLVKYFATIPLVILFILTMNPSDFAASFNRLGVPYRVAYSISLTLRYIPDIQRDYFNIRNAQAARGVVGDGKVSLIQKIGRTLKLIFPLILTSFNRIETISQAMMLRRFGRGKQRTWYVARPMQARDYYVILLAFGWLGLVGLFYWLNQGRFYNPF